MKPTLSGSVELDADVSHTGILAYCWRVSTVWSLAGPAPDQGYCGCLATASGAGNTRIMWRPWNSEWWRRLLYDMVLLVVTSIISRQCLHYLSERLLTPEHSYTEWYTASVQITLRRDQQDIPATVFRRHRWQTISPIANDVTILWSAVHVRALCSHGRRYRQDFLCIYELLQPHVSPRSC